MPKPTAVKSLHQQQRTRGFVCFFPLTWAQLGWEKYVLLHSTEQGLSAGNLEDWNPLSAGWETEPEATSGCLGVCLHCPTGVPGTKLKGSVLAVLLVQVSNHSWALSGLLQDKFWANSSFLEQLPKITRNETITVWLSPLYMSLQHIPPSFIPSEADDVLLEHLIHALSFILLKTGDLWQTCHIVVFLTEKKPTR